MEYIFKNIVAELINGTLIFKDHVFFKETKNTIIFSNQPLEKDSFFNFFKNKRIKTFKLFKLTKITMFNSIIFAEDTIALSEITLKESSRIRFKNSNKSLKISLEDFSELILFADIIWVNVTSISSSISFKQCNFDKLTISAKKTSIHSNSCKFLNIDLKLDSDSNFRMDH